MEVKQKALTVGDLVSVYCDNPKIQKQVQSLNIKSLTCEPFGKEVISMLALVADVANAQKKMGPSDCVQVVPLGEPSIIVQYCPSKEKGKLLQGVEIALVSLVTFFGSIFAIMSYNEDVDVTGVFAKIYGVVLGYVPSQPGLLELTYGIGLALGIIVFFNHFGKKKITSDPTPMEVAMEKYEKDISNTIIKEKTREGQVRDVD